MKNLRTIAPLFIVPVLFSAALAQEPNSEISDQLPAAVAVARCQYTPWDEACLSLRLSGAVNSEKSPDGPLAQMPRRIPEPLRLPHRQPGPYPRTGYPRRILPAPNPRHAAIAFLLGFTLGVVHPTDRTARSHVGLGLICGGFGAIIGAALPSFSSHRQYPAGSWPDDDHEMASRSKAAQPASPEPTPADAALTATAPTSPAGSP